MKIACETLKYLFSEISKEGGKIIFIIIIINKFKFVQLLAKGLQGLQRYRDVVNMYILADFGPWDVRVQTELF